MFPNAITLSKAEIAYPEVIDKLAILQESFWLRFEIIMKTRIQFFDQIPILNDSGSSKLFGLCMIA